MCLEHDSDMKTMNLFVLVGLLLTGCSDDADRKALLTAPPDTQGAVKTQPAQLSAARERASAKVVRGRKLFAQNCAPCHGSQAEGAPRWSTPGADGKYPPPPLDGTAHAWHHSTAVLKRTIREGTIVIGGTMPPWGDKLSDEDMEAIIAWFQSLWPDEIYDAWARMDAEVSNKE